MAGRACGLPGLVFACSRWNVHLEQVLAHCAVRRGRARTLLLPVGEGALREQACAAAEAFLRASFP